MRTGGLLCLSSVALENNFSWRKRGAQVRAKLITKASLRQRYGVMGTKRWQVRSEIKTKCLEKESKWHKYIGLLRGPQRLLEQKNMG